MTIRILAPAVAAYLAIGFLPALLRGEDAAPPFAAPTSADAARDQIAAPPGGEPLAAGSARTRYHRFNGRWWYWLPNKQWALWDGNQWTIPSSKANDYQQWRSQQFAGRYNASAAQDEAVRRLEVDRWRSQSTERPLAIASRLDANHSATIDRLHDNLTITPYDYRIGTAGHGLFDANPDRTIGNSGKLNYATSTGGYIGGALRSPYGY